METRANAVAIGTFVLAVLGLAFGSVYWFYTAGTASQQKELIVAFEGAVTGLTKSAAVYFNGIKVGNVTAIQFAEDDPTRVLAYAKVDANAPLKTDTTVELGFQGVTGVAHIEMKGGTKSSPDLFAEPGIPRLVAKPSAFQDILQTARQVLTKVDTSLSDISKVLTESRQPFINTVQNIEVVTKAVADNSDNISTFLADMSTAGKSIASLSAELEVLVKQAVPVFEAFEPETVKTIVADAARLTRQLADSAGKVETIIASAEKAASEIETFTEGLNTSLKKVDGVLSAVDQEKVASMIDGLEAITGSFRDKKEEVSALIDSARDTADNLSEITGGLADRSEEIDGILVGASEVVKNTETITRNLTGASDNAAKIVAAVDPDAVKGTIDGVSKLTTQLAGRTESFDKIISDTEAALADARVAVSNARELTATFSARKQSVDSIISNVESATGKLPGLSDDISETLDQVQALATAVEVDKINQAVTNIADLTGRVAKKGDDIDAIVASARKSTENLESFTDALSNKSSEVQQIVDQALELSKRLNATSVRINGLINKVDGVVGDAETGGLISEARRAATSIANISEAFESRASRIARGVERLSSTGVSKFEDLIDLGQRALRQIERSVQSLEQNPQGVLFGGPQVRQFGGGRR